MKIYGTLESAQFELLSANPGNTPTGRFYMNITAPAAGVPWIYDGSAWRRIMLGTSNASGFVTQNSTGTCTVDWSQGLFQQINLTAHCTIRFINPQAGQNHVLYVVQRVQETGLGTYNIPFVYKFDMADQDPKRGNYQPIGCGQSSESQVYTWFYSPGIKAAYVNIPFQAAVPATLPPATCFGIDVSPDGKYVAQGCSTTPFVGVSAFFDGGAQSLLGLRNNVVPTAAANTANNICYHPDNWAYFVSSGTSPFIQGYFLDRGAGLTAMANPATLPAGVGQCLAIHPTGAAVGIGHTTTPFMSFYPVSSAGFGVKYGNPVTLPAAQVNGLAFSPLGNYLAAASQTTPFIQVWPFDLTTGFGTILSNPSSLPINGPVGQFGKPIAWRPQSDYIAMAMASAPWLYVVNFNATTGVFGSSVSTAASTLSATVNCVQFTPDGQYLLVGTSTAPYLYIYDFSLFTIGAPLTYEASNPTGQVNDIVVHPSGEYVFVSMNVTPFIRTYLLPRKIRNYMKLVV